jgi:peptidoglycan/xylan/chitin deacetylase (PgdA/CDA1 family)
MITEGLPLLAWPMHRRVLTILIYHRVLPKPDPLRYGEIVADGFDEQMRFLAKHFVVIPLPEAARLLKQGKLPARACCITFDDGYADNLTVALPILEKYGLPATVFVATGYLDGGRMFNDTVMDAIAHAERSELDLCDIDLGCHSLVTLEERQAAAKAILWQLRFRPPERRIAEVASLVERTGCGPLPSDIMLTSGQVRELADRGVEIGGHTVTHPILTSVEDDRVLEEMEAGKRQLEAITGKSVRTFAYPNGKPERDYAARHVSMARKVGFELAVSTASGVATRDSDIFQLPRFIPWGALSKLGVRMLKNAWTGEVR